MRAISITVCPYISREEGNPAVSRKKQERWGFPQITEFRRQQPAENFVTFFRELLHLQIIRFQIPRLFGGE